MCTRTKSVSSSRDLFFFPSLLFFFLFFPHFFHFPFPVFSTSRLNFTSTSLFSTYFFSNSLLHSLLTGVPRYSNLVGECFYCTRGLLTLSQGFSILKELLELLCNIYQLLINFTYMYQMLLINFFAVIYSLSRGGLPPCLIHITVQLNPGPVSSCLEETSFITISLSALWTPIRSLPFHAVFFLTS